LTVLVVGSGIVSAAGRGRERTFAALRAGGREPSSPKTIGRDGPDALPVFETDDGALSGFGGRLPPGRGRRSLRLALVAAWDALAEAEGSGFASVAPDRVAVVVGATVGGMNHGEEWIARCRVPGESRLAARAAIRHVPLWEVPRQLAARHGFTGPCFAVSTACTSGAQAIATAADLVAGGVCDAALAGGVDCLARLTYDGFASLGVASRRRCTPFDGARSGLNLGEGAAFVALLSDRFARRGRTQAVLSGWSCNTDAHHPTAPRPDGSGVAAAFTGALRAAGAATSDVGWVHAHGTATPTNDAVESAAVRAAFGARRVPVSSTKHVFGHTLGAAGAISTVVSLQALNEAFVPGNAAIAKPDPACDVDVVPPEGLAVRPRHALVGSLGFGGASCALLLSEATA
jgi:3-oxoacyl-[acyl-carrier-protein] synthase II